MQILERKSALKVTGSAVRLSEERVTDAKQQIGKALTASGEGDEEGEQISQVLASLTPKERREFSRMPAWKQERFFEKITKEERHSDETVRVPEQKNMLIQNAHRQDQKIAAEKKKRYAAYRSTDGNRNRRYKNDSQLYLSDQIREEQKKTAGKRRNDPASGIEDARSGREPWREERISFGGGQSLSAGTSGNVSSGWMTREQTSVFLSEGTRQGAQGAAQGATQGAKQAGVSATASVSAAPASGGLSIAYESSRAVERKVKRSVGRIRDTLMESVAQKEEIKIMQLRQDRKEEKKNQTEDSQAFSHLLKLGVIAAAGGTFLLLMVVLLLFSSSKKTTSGDVLESPEGAQQIVAVAEQELAVSEDNIGGQKYKDWYGLDGNWCAMFVSYCADQCGYIESGCMPKTASVTNMKNWYYDKGQYHSKSAGYIPKAGDIIIFGNGTSHTGIVIDYDAEKGVVTTIEGNTGTSNTNPYHKGSCVKKQSYPLTKDTIVGFCTPAYPQPEEEETETETESSPAA